MGLGFPPPDLAGSRVTIHDRHLDIHEHDVVGAGNELLNAISPLEATSALHPLDFK